MPNTLNSGLMAAWNFDDPDPGTCVDTATGGCSLVNELSSVGVNILLVNQPAFGADPKWEALDGTSGGQFVNGAQGTNFRDSSLFFDIGGGSDGDNLASLGAGGDVSTISFPTGQSFSIAAWVNNNSFGNILAKKDIVTAGIGTNDDEYRIQSGVGTNQYQFSLSDGKPPSGFHGIVALSPVNSAILNQYQLVVAIYNGALDQGGIGIDGAYPIFVQGSVGNFGSSSNELYLGRGVTGIPRISANYKFLAFWRRVITLDEVIRLFAGGRGNRYPFVDQPFFPDLPDSRITV